jgi:regulatory protein
VSRTVTALEVQKRNHERVNIYLDGEFAFGLPIVDAARLRKGQVLSDEEIKALCAIDEVARAFDQAVTLLARRPYSAAEIRRHLETKRVALSVIEEVLARLSQSGYIDDRTFVQYWIENREQFKPRGARALQQELRQKGISQDLIDEALEVLDLHDSAYRAAQEKIRRLHGLKQSDFRVKLGSFLVRRGFDYDIVREVIERLIGELEEQNPDYFVSNQTCEE